MDARKIIVDFLKEREWALYRLAKKSGSPPSSLYAAMRGEALGSVYGVALADYLIGKKALKQGNRERFIVDLTVARKTETAASNNKTETGKV